MNRREFVSRMSVGAAALCASVPTRTAAAAGSGLNLRFVGMMGFVRRTDGSFLVATPGPETHGHLSHTPFLMARRGTAVAAALGMTPAVGVIPGAFDMRLADARPEDFVYRCLDNTSLDVVSGTDAAVTNASSQMAQMARIAPGKRVRGNLERWALSTVSLRGGRLVDSAAHPDAGKTWAFGSYRQRLTDAVNFEGPAGSVLRLTTGDEARTLRVASTERSELWVVSASTATGDSHNPTRLEHSRVAFDFLADATPVMAECPDATGREVPPTEMPCSHPSSASMGIVAEGGRFPPYTDLCFPIVIISDLIG